jgi:hypothetical protein
MEKLLKHTVVWLFRDWDRRGTCAATECVVDSWGKQQIHLRETGTGQMMRHRFYTSHINQPGCHHIYAARDLSNVTDRGLCLAAEYLELRRQSLTRCLIISDNAYYLAAIRKDIEQLHEPRVVRVQDHKVVQP